MTWRPDILPGYSAFDIPLDDVSPAEGEPTTDRLRATLVRREGPPHRRAALSVHGWNDYFFHTHVADLFADLGFDFYALDLRRYGRSLIPGQFPGYVTDLRDYFAELDAAVEMIEADHDELILIGHSTGGLTCSLWAHERPGRLTGLILNSPWLALQGSWLVRAIAAPLLASLAQRSATMPIPIPEISLYSKSIHAKYGGEWNYDLSLKTETAPIRAGWVNAVLSGHDAIVSGLEITAPILVLCSARSDFRAKWDPVLRSVDSVLDVPQIAARATKLGFHVTVVRIPGAVHDVTLSSAPVRARIWGEIRRWVEAYAVGGENT